METRTRTAGFPETSAKFAFFPVPFTYPEYQLVNRLFHLPPTKGTWSRVDRSGRGVVAGDG